MGGVIVLLVVLVVVGLAVFSLWKMARKNEEMVPGGSVGRQLTDIFKRSRQRDADR